MSATALRFFVLRKPPRPPLALGLRLAGLDCLRSVSIPRFFFCTIYGAFWAGPIGILSIQSAGVMLITLAVTLVFCRASWIFFEKLLVQIGNRMKYQFAGAAPHAPLTATAPRGRQLA